MDLRLSAALLFVSLLPVVAQAEPPPARAHYVGYAAGLPVFTLDLTAALPGAAYRLELSFRLTGVLGALYHAEATSSVVGRIEGGHALPRQLLSRGRFGSEPHATEVEWQGDAPRFVRMLPPVEPQREKVPASAQTGTVDTLSAIATLLQQASANGSCDAAARTFDGARLSEFSAHTFGPETLEPTDRSSFAGSALRCDVTGRMVAGFMPDSDRAALGKPKRASAWLARLHPGEPMVPVRIAIYPEGSPPVFLYVAD